MKASNLVPTFYTWFLSVYSTHYYTVVTAQLIIIYCNTILVMHDQPPPQMMYNVCTQVQIFVIGTQL